VTDLAKVEVVLTGTGVVGGGVSTFYCLESGVSGLPDALETFYGVVAANSPDNVTFTVPSSGDVIDDTSGELSGTWSTPGEGGSFAGAASSGFQMGVGARIRWNTPGTRGGRRVVGTTFLVPLASSAFTTDGFLLTTVQTALQNAGTALIAAHEFRILSRPSGPLPDGISWTVVSCAVPLNVSWLRSRRT
jgi:hypothetical protein